MSTCQKWKLKRYARFVPGSKEEGGKPWKVFESVDGKPELMLTIVESGHLLVTEGHELLDGLSLLDTSESTIKVQQKADNLIFRLNIKGDSRVMRMQFRGSAGVEAVMECTNAVLTLKAYPSVSSLEDSLPVSGRAPAPNQPPAKITASIMQHFLGEHSLPLPLMYRHCSLPQDNMEPFLRLCLLDPTFPALVQVVEEELKKLLQE